jgi:hypothetical protein
MVFASGTGTVSCWNKTCQEEGKWLEPYKGLIENVSRRYVAAAITHMDDSIGKLRETLRREGIEEQTIMVFLSDNGGPRGGDNTRWLVPPREYYMSYGATDVLSDNLPLRGWKGIRGLHPDITFGLEHITRIRFRSRCTRNSTGRLSRILRPPSSWKEQFDRRVLGVA